MVAATELKQSVLERSDRYRVTVEQYVTFRKRGFVVIPQLVAPAEVDQLRQHTDDLMQGRLPQQSRQMNRIFQILLPCRLCQQSGISGSIGGVLLLFCFCSFFLASMSQR